MHVHLGKIATTAAAVLISMGSADFARASTAVPDGWITTKTKMSILTNEGVSARKVDVDTIDGRVTLHGIVGSEAEKARAEQLTRSISGVHEVRNLLQVAGQRAQPKLKASDKQLAQRVSSALDADGALVNSRIVVQSVNAGVVLLSGKATSLSDAYRAVRVASSVDGVRRVASEVQTPDEMADRELWREGRYDAASDARSTASDMWITTEAKVRLIARSETPGFDINVDTEKGIVTLFGAVDSTATKKQAEAVVRDIDGVVDVVNDLQIVPAGAEQAVARSDKQISAAIEQRIEARPALSDSDIDIEVSSGVARLTGIVHSRGDQLTALTVAGSTDGVKRVIDDLRLVEPPSVSAR